MEIYNNTILEDDLPKGAKNFIKAATKSHVSFDSARINQAKYGYVSMSADVTPKTTNPYGMIHGGILFTLADSVAGLTAISMGKKVVTMNSNINFLKSTTSGSVHAYPTILHAGRTTVILEVNIEDDFENLICKASFTMFVIGDMSEYEDEDE